MNEEIRWAVIGNATIARRCMLSAISKSRGHRIQVLATHRPQAAVELSRIHGIAKVVEDYAAALTDPEVDAVYIPLPNHLHYPWTLKALAAGKHVLCEKPLACNARQAQEMAEAARGAGRLLMEALMYRFHPRSVQIKARVARGDLGKPCLIRSAFTFRIDEDTLVRGAGARLQSDQGGGALLDVGSYGVSTARWLLESEPRMVQGVARWHGNGVDLQFVGLLEFEDGAMATIEAGFVCALQQTISIIGSQAAIELPHNAYIPWEDDTEYVLRRTDEETGEVIRVAGADEYQLMVNHFGDAIRGKCPPTIALDDSVRNLEVLDVLARAAREKRTILLPPPTSITHPDRR